MPEKTPVSELMELEMYYSRGCSSFADRSQYPNNAEYYRIHLQRIRKIIDARGEEIIKNETTTHA